MASSGSIVNIGFAFAQPKIWPGPLSKLDIGAIAGGNNLNGYFKRLWLWPNIVLTRDQLRTVGRIVR